MQPTALQKQEAWQKVAKLCAEAAAALVAVNEGAGEIPKLQWIEEKARVQVNLWS